ncbi:hypothetical protein [Demequina muriae]|uniref:Uncharacterized protein n=1 Tax=Demequina muriae TaxID=3051664 RepID=A0ABT8GF86_9MICO|nr:hypothetical protein [Demequina sp. EGI L300058]MDN4480097.1 hypothetical protein [Demequina sp. EGI L300058]
MVAGLLAIVALGIVVAYVLPQRIKERGEYALVRVDDRYSSDMRVVKSTAERMEKAAARPSSDSGEVPLLRTGSQRATRLSDRAESMSRPATPLDRAAVHAQRERDALRRDRAVVLAERAAQARRRATVAFVAMMVATATWIAVAFTTLTPVVGAVATAAFAGIIVTGSRAAAAQRRADESIRAVAREVEAAATATQALRTVTRERAAGHEVQPSDVATQAIRVLTTEDLAPLAAPAPVPSPELPLERSTERTEERTEEPTPWTPQDMPAPAYTLKSSVRPRQARPISDEDYDVAKARAARWGDLRADDAPAQSTNGQHVAEEPASTTAALDQILARRRRASA